MNMTSSYENESKWNMNGTSHWGCGSFGPVWKFSAERQKFCREPSSGCGDSFVEVTLRTCSSKQLRCDTFRVNILLWKKSTLQISVVYHFLSFSHILVYLYHNYHNLSCFFIIFDSNGIYIYIALHSHISYIVYTRGGSGTRKHHWVNPRLRAVISLPRGIPYGRLWYHYFGQPPCLYVIYPGRKWCFAKWSC